MVNFQSFIRFILKRFDLNLGKEDLEQTPKRMEKAYEFMLKGYKEDPKTILSQALYKSSNDQMIIVKDIKFYSLCQHHLLPFFGTCHLAYMPKGQVVGLSKIPRLVEVFARRLQLQENLSEDIAKAFMQIIQPKGVAVCIEARHLCMEMRGVQQKNSHTNTLSIKGNFAQDITLKQEFLTNIR